MNVKKNYLIKIEGICDDFLVICDHSSNNIPLIYNSLGISKKDLNSHRAYDLGASDVACELSKLLQLFLQGNRSSLETTHFFQSPLCKKWLLINQRGVAFQAH